MDDPAIMISTFGWRPLTIQKEASNERMQIRRRADRFLLRQDKLYYRDADGEPKLAWPRATLKEVLQEFHDGAIGGHFGRDITIASVRQQFWWPTIWKDVAEYVKTCDKCQRYGPKDHHNALRPFQPAYPFEFIFMDFVVNLPSTPGRTGTLSP